MQGQPGVQEFDRHVLGCIFRHLRDPQGRLGRWSPATCALVCKEWRAVYLGELAPVRELRAHAVAQLGTWLHRDVRRKLCRVSIQRWLRRHVTGATSADISLLVLCGAEMDDYTTLLAAVTVWRACRCTLTALRLAMPLHAGSMLRSMGDQHYLTQLEIDLRPAQLEALLAPAAASIGPDYVGYAANALCEELIIRMSDWQQLRALTLRGGRAAVPLDELLEALPTALTALAIDGTSFEGGLRNVRQLSRLTALQRLALCGQAQSRDYSEHIILPPGITALSRLTRLELARNGLLRHPPPQLLDHLPHLLHLDLGRTLLPPAAQLDLSTASALTFLALTGFVASKVDLAMLSALRCLLLYECHLFEPPHGLGRLSALTRLDLSRGLNGKLAIPLAAAYPPTLRELSVAACNLRQLPLHLPSLTALTSLNLSSNTLPAGWERLGALAGVLQRLSLARCQLRAVPDVLGTLCALTSLDLGGNEGMELDPTRLTGLPRLQALSLENLGLTTLPPGLSALPSTLTSLDLGSNPGLGGLGALRTLGGLRRLDLSGCWGLLELPPGKGLTGLTWLGLRQALCGSGVVGGSAQATALAERQRGPSATPAAAVWADREEWTQGDLGREAAAAAAGGGWVGRLEGMALLQELDLSGCPISTLPPGLRSLHALSRMRLGPLPRSGGSSGGEAASAGSLAAGGATAGAAAGWVLQLSQEDAAWLREEFAEGGPFVCMQELVRVWR